MKNKKNQIDEVIVDVMNPFENKDENILENKKNHKKFKIQSKKDSLKKIGYCLVVLLIPVMLFLYSLQAKRYTDLRREVIELENMQEKLIEENRKLVSDISQLTSADRIEKIAVEELGMHKAESSDIVRVEMTGEKK